MNVVNMLPPEGRVLQREPSPLLRQPRFCGSLGCAARQFDMRMYVIADGDVLCDPEAFNFTDCAFLKFVYSRRRAPA